MSFSNTGRVVVISGPSGAGKTTLMKELFQRTHRPLVASVSATTRKPRPNEINGEDYHFLTQAEFDLRRKNGDFLECFEVFGRGYWYGTLWNEVTPSLAAGKWVVLEIDVQGTKAVLGRYPDALTIFVGTESLAELERRLRGRGTESEEAIQRRLEVARREVKAATFYQHHVVNDTLDRAVGELVDILERG